MALEDLDETKRLVMHQQHIYKLPTLEPKAASRFAGNFRGVAASFGGKKLQEAADISMLHLRKLACSHVSGLLAVAKCRHVGLLNMESLATSNAGRLPCCPGSIEGLQALLARCLAWPGMH